MDNPTPEELNSKCEELRELFLTNTTQFAKEIHNNHAEWLTVLATDDRLRSSVLLLVRALTDDLETISSILLELSDFL